MEGYIMNRPRIRSAIRNSAKRWLSPFAILALASCAPDEGGGDSPPVAAELALVPALPDRAVCDQPTRPGFARCHSRVRLDRRGAIHADATPAGLGPADLQDAYK